jgi:hypothetical protein
MMGIFDAITMVVRGWERLESEFLMQTAYDYFATLPYGIGKGNTV